ncbi:MAG: phosphatase PAP2 family protein [Leptospira sp.]|nr:phosphatase PAP2 family protein [Leptospira sp.]
MFQHVLFENQIFFGNSFLEIIPHPAGSLGELLKYLSVFCHYAGGITFFVFLLPFVYLCYNRQFGIKLALAVLSTGIINGLTKFYSESARPLFISPQVEELRKIANESSYGFPSGHAHVTMLVWGLLFLHFKNRYFRSFALFMILFTPFSRLYMGVHYPGDVIGGALTGLISLALITLLFEKFPDFPDISFIRDEQQKQKVLRSISLVLAALTLPATLLFSGEGNAAKQASISQVVAASASFAGLFTGLLYLKFRFGKNFYDWDLAKNLPSFIARILIIFSGIIVLYFGAGRIEKMYFENEFLFRYFRYFILNIFLILGAPLILKRIQNGRFLERQS